MEEEKEQFREVSFSVGVKGETNQKQQCGKNSREMSPSLHLMLQMSGGGSVQWSKHNH